MLPNAIHSIGRRLGGSQRQAWGAERHNSQSRQQPIPSGGHFSNPLSSRVVQKLVVLLFSVVAIGGRSGPVWERPKVTVKVITGESKAQSIETSRKLVYGEEINKAAIVLAIGSPLRGEE
jgi:hypothetical protein